jgi:RNA polymerase sigma-70 factor (ECF subfamily)
MEFLERISRAQCGEREAVELLLAEWRPWLRNQARGLLTAGAAGRMDSSDVVQNTLVEAFRNLKRFRGGSPQEFSGWLRQILRTQAAIQRRFHTAEVRRAERECCASWSVGDSSGRPPVLAVRSERRVRLQAALTALPDSLRDVVLGRIFQERSFNELAEQLGRTPRVLRRQWAEALRRLAEALGSLTSSHDVRLG